jgi:hypothetical protein
MGKYPVTRIYSPWKPPLSPLYDKGRKKEKQDGPE